MGRIKRTMRKYVENGIYLIKMKAVLLPFKFTHWEKIVITELWQSYEPQLSVPQLSSVS